VVVVVMVGDEEGVNMEYNRMFGIWSNKEFSGTFPSSSILSQLSSPPFYGERLKFICTICAQSLREPAIKRELEILNPTPPSAPEWGKGVKCS